MDPSGPSKPRVVEEHGANSPDPWDPAAAAAVAPTGSSCRGTKVAAGGSAQSGGVEQRHISGVLPPSPGEESTKPTQVLCARSSEL